MCDAEDRWKCVCSNAVVLGRVVITVCADATTTSGRVSMQHAAALCGMVLTSCNIVREYSAALNLTHGSEHCAFLSTVLRNLRA